MQQTRTRRIAGLNIHLLGGAPKEQEYLVTYHDIPDELWGKVMAIKRAEERAKKRARGRRLGPPNKFTSVPKEPPKPQVQHNMSQPTINVETDLNRSRPSSRPGSRPSSQPSSRPPSQPSSQPSAQSIEQPLSRPSSGPASRTPSTSPML